MANRRDVAARLIDAAMDHPLGIKPHPGALHRLGIELVFEDVVGLDQKRRARARQEIAVRIGRMAHADMAEGIDHAFIGQDAVGKAEFRDEIGHIIRHGRSSKMAAAFGQLPSAGLTNPLPATCATPVPSGRAMLSIERRRRFPGQE